MTVSRAARREFKRLADREGLTEDTVMVLFGIPHFLNQLSEAKDVQFTVKKNCSLWVLALYFNLTFKVVGNYFSFV